MLLMYNIHIHDNNCFAIHIVLYSIFFIFVDSNEFDDDVLAAGGCVWRSPMSEMVNIIIFIVVVVVIILVAIEIQ